MLTQTAHYKPLPGRPVVMILLALSRLSTQYGAFLHGVTGSVLMQFMCSNAVVRVDYIDCRLALLFITWFLQNVRYIC